MRSIDTKSKRFRLYIKARGKPVTEAQWSPETKWLDPWRVTKNGIPVATGMEESRLLKERFCAVGWEEGAGEEVHLYSIGGCALMDFSPVKRKESEWKMVYHVFVQD